MVAASLIFFSLQTNTRWCEHDITKAHGHYSQWCAMCVPTGREKMTRHHLLGILVRTRQSQTVRSRRNWHGLLRELRAFSWSPAFFGYYLTGGMKPSTHDDVLLLLLAAAGCSCWRECSLSLWAIGSTWEGAVKRVSLEVCPAPEMALSSDFMYTFLMYFLVTCTSCYRCGTTARRKSQGVNTYLQV